LHRSIKGIEVHVEHLNQKKFKNLRPESTVADDDFNGVVKAKVS